MDKILEAIELNHPLANQESTYDVFLKDKTAVNNPKFIAQ